MESLLLYFFESQGFLAENELAIINSDILFCTQDNQISRSFIYNKIKISIQYLRMHLSLITANVRARP